VLLQRNDLPISTLDNAVRTAGTIILGKARELRLALACLLAQGHLLIEDLPGLGKTTLAHTLARLLGLQYSRIQFTSDLLPADIVGTAVYDRQQQRFKYHPGPIFSQLVLADEINRATPKAQSALLEAMEERQVTVEGQTRPLPSPFFVIATQNPTFQIGTFPLPESQLDRFLMRIHLGYPAAEQEKLLLAGRDRREMVAGLEPALDVRTLELFQRRVREVHAAPVVIDYCYALVERSRRSGRFLHGLSPRAGLGLLHSARAWALLAGRDYVLPEDVQAVAGACLNHRLVSGEDNAPVGNSDPAEELLRSVPVP
jgi:MoxR-like ATPase